MNRNSIRICGRKTRKAPTPYDAVDQKVGWQAWSKPATYDLAGTAYDTLNESDQRIGAGEQRLKNDRHQCEKQKETEHRVKKHLVDAIGQRH